MANKNTLVPMGDLKFELSHWLIPALWFLHQKCTINFIIFFISFCCSTYICSAGLPTFTMVTQKTFLALEVKQAFLSLKGILFTTPAAIIMAIFIIMVNKAWYSTIWFSAKLKMSKIIFFTSQGGCAFIRACAYLINHLIREPWLTKG